MSIPFCIATTLVHGPPTMAHMTRYDDAAVNALEARITLVPDERVPILSCVIEADMADGATLIQDQRMTAADYAYDRVGVSALIRRIGTETDVPAAAYDRLECFAAGLPDADLDDVIAAFAERPRI